MGIILFILFLIGFFIAIIANESDLVIASMLIASAIFYISDQISEVVEELKNINQKMEKDK